MLQQVTDELTPTSTTDIILTFEPDSIASSLNLIEGEKSAEVQPDLSYDLDGNLNSRGNHWFYHIDASGRGYHYINSNGTRYYEYYDKSNVFCDPHRDGMVRYRSPSEGIERVVRGKGSTLHVIKRSNDRLTLHHLYSPQPMGKLQNDMYRKYVSKSNQNL